MARALVGIYTSILLILAALLLPPGDVLLWYSLLIVLHVVVTATGLYSLRVLHLPAPVSRVTVGFLATLAIVTLLLAVPVTATGMAITGLWGATSPAVLAVIAVDIAFFMLSSFLIKSRSRSLHIVAIGADGPSLQLLNDFYASRERVFGRVQVVSEYNQPAHDVDNVSGETRLVCFCSSHRSQSSHGHPSSPIRRNRSTSVLDCRIVSQKPFVTAVSHVTTRTRPLSLVLL